MLKGITSGHWIREIILGLSLSALALLNGCSTVTKDGPPPYDVDVSKIPDAVPKAEKLSKYGNKPTYQVFGKRYYVMSSSRNYEEKGVASWYGTKFHTRHTSNGERYNMLAMTAAHKTLPLPTYVQVTNLKNGRKVIVKVNDRGPFEGNRIIDLSYAAAKKLGMLGHGTALVDIKAIDPTSYHKTYTNSFFLTSNTNTSTYLQIGVFRNKSYAENLRRKISPLIESPIHITQLENKKKLYRVQIGPISNVAMMTKINKQLKSIGLTSKKIVV